MVNYSKKFNNSINRNLFKKVVLYVITVAVSFILFTSEATAVWYSVSPSRLNVDDYTLGNIGIGGYQSGARLAIYSQTGIGNISIQSQTAQMLYFHLRYYSI